MAKLKLHGFDSYQKVLKEGIYKPGFITEYEDESIDNLTDDQTAPASDAGADATPATDATPAEAAPVEQTTAAEEPAEEPAVATEPEADVDFGASAGTPDSETNEYSTKIQLVSGIFDEYKTYLKNNGQLQDSMKKKIDSAFDLLNGED